jgi:2-hydroxychromene-2-carboxylate isomerase
MPPLTRSTDRQGDHWSEYTAARGPEPVEFFFAIGSRYSYLASTQLEALERETSCKVRWRPLYSVDLMKLRGKNPFEGPPVSGQYEWSYRQADAAAWAEYYGVPFREPLGLEMDPRFLAHACVAAGQLGAGVPFCRALFQAIFVDGPDEIGAEECARRAETVGLSGAELLQRIEDPAVERELQATVEDAHARGVFGVPSFVVRGRLFWGNDRLVLVRHHLQKLAAAG